MTTPAEAPNSGGHTDGFPSQGPHPVAGTFPRSDAEVAARVKAMESILVEKNLIASDAIDYMSSVFENEVGPHLGA